jgi:hypothetical protein
MAVSIHTVGINTADVGTWNSSDIITILEKQFEWLGWHGDTDYGLAIGISSVSTGINSISGSSLAYYDAQPTSTTGTGTRSSIVGRRFNGTLDVTPFTGQLVNFHLNRPGYGYTGGEIITIPSTEFGNPSAPDATFQLIVDATISGGVSYAVTFTGLYDASGTDRNGVVSGQGTTITIKEGDTLKLVGNQSSSSYELSIIRGDQFGGPNVSAEITNYAVGYSPLGYISGSGGGFIEWTPRWGQRGLYYVRPHNSTGFGTATPMIIVEPADSGNITTTGYGSTTTFYDKNLNGSSSYGILKDVIDPNKKYGTTYRSFAFINDSTLYMASGSSYNPVPYYSNSTTSITGVSGGHGYGRNFGGSPHLDWNSKDIFNDDTSPFYDISGFLSDYSATVSTGGYTTYQLDLIVYRSSVDPDFAVFSFNTPTRSSTHFRDTTFGTWFHSRYTTNVWDLNYLFLSGTTLIVGNGNGATNDPKIGFYSTYQGVMSPSETNPSKRSAEFGYNQFSPSETSTRYAINEWESKAFKQSISASTPSIYYRPGGTDQRTMGGNSYSATATDKLDPETDFNAVVKGIPIQCTWIPCPYYLPDDFVLINFSYNQVSANIQQGDTVTISGSEVYKVIEASYNQSTVTSGILFCARTV